VASLTQGDSEAMENLTVIPNELSVIASPINEKMTFDSLLVNSGLAASTQMQYGKAFNNAMLAGVDITSVSSIQAYASGLKTSSQAFLKASLKMYTNALVLDAKGRATPGNVGAVQATVYRVEAIQESIKVTAAKGDKAHVWLSLIQIREMLAICDKTLKGKRDRVVLSLLLGCGLRRDELVRACFSDIKKQGKRWVLQVVGKGEKGRIIPLSDTLVSLLKSWEKIAKDGYIARSVGKGGRLGDSLSSVGVFKIVGLRGKQIGETLAPHDLRRTFAQVGLDGGVPIQQISVLLGHSDIATTQRYLNVKLDLTNTVCDIIPLSLW
jgi:integrase